MKIQFSALSERDLDGIFLYINETLRNPTAAQNTVKGIISLAAHVSDFPKLGAVLPMPHSSNLEIRYVLSGSYLVAYMIGSTHIEIVRILYARSDYLRLLGSLR